MPARGFSEPSDFAAVQTHLPRIRRRRGVRVPERRRKGEILKSYLESPRRDGRDKTQPKCETTSFPVSLGRAGARQTGCRAKHVNAIGHAYGPVAIDIALAPCHCTLNFDDVDRNTAVSARDSVGEVLDGQ